MRIYRALLRIYRAFKCTTVSQFFRLFLNFFFNRSQLVSTDISANVKNNKYKDVYGVVRKAFAPAIVGMSGQIHADFLRLLWVLADKQMRSYYESIDKEDNIGTEAFRWARAKVFNCNHCLWMRHPLPSVCA